MLRLIILSIFLAMGVLLNAQNCQPIPNPSQALDCSSATFLCCGELNDVSGTLPSFTNLEGPSTICPGVSNAFFNNVVWYAFAAGSSQITFQVNLMNCINTGNGVGAQIGIYEDCSFMKAVYCNANQLYGTVVIPLNDLEIGNVYYLFIDGWNGSVCDYNFVVTSGSTFSSPSLSPTDIVGPENTCNGEAASYAAAYGQHSNQNVWSVTPSSVDFIDYGDHIEMTGWGLPNGGTVEICVTGINDCYPDPNGVTPFCKTINVAPNDVEIVAGSYCQPNESGYVFPENGQTYSVGTHLINIPNGSSCFDAYQLTVTTNIFEEVFGSYCEEDGGFLFPVNGQIYSVGMHQVEVPNGTSCPDKYILEVTTKPNFGTDLNIVLCPGESYLFEGTTYEAPFTGQIPLDSTGANGCLEVVNLNLTAIDTAISISANPSVVLNCNDVSQILLVADFNPNSNINYSYEWNTANGCILGSASGPSIVVNCPGIYELNITMETFDDEGMVSCMSTPTSIEVFENLTDLEVVISASPQSCMDDGAATASLIGGFGDPTYAWSNMDSTATITGLSPGNYFVTVTDVLGCTAIGNVFIEAAFDLNVSSTVADCNTANGTATATVSGGISDPIYAWSIGQMTATAVDLVADWYSVTVTDNATNCRTHQNIAVMERNNCFVKITGHVQIETSNTDCIEDNETVPAKFVQVELSDGQIAYTDSDGYYEFITDAGIYEIVISPNTLFEALCADPITIDADVWGNTYSDNNFYLEYGSRVDMRIKVVKPNARPGFTQTVSIGLMNVGGQPVSGTLTFTHSEILEFVESTPMESTYDLSSRTLTWAYNDIPPGAVWNYFPKLKIPIGTDLGTNLEYNFQADPINGDFNPDDNKETCSILVTGSYDPNDKLVNPAGSGAEGFIAPADTSLSYTIRFQNTGTDTAFTVLLRDTLDNAIDVRSIEPGPASHPYTARIQSGNVLELLFENIMLPDSFVNEEASNGFAIFDVRLKDDLPLGTEIRNRAGIYFDYNPPIITNTVLNTIMEPVALTELNSSEIWIELLPNPNQGYAQLRYQLDASAFVNISLYDVLGNQLKVLETGVRKGKGKHQLNLSMETYSSGIYFVKLETAQGAISTVRMVKM